MHPVEVGADGVEVGPAGWTEYAWEFHACLSVAEGAIFPLDFVLDYPGEDGIGGQALSKLYAIIFDLN